MSDDQNNPDDLQSKLASLRAMLKADHDQAAHEALDGLLNHGKKVLRDMRRFLRQQLH